MGYNSIHVMLGFTLNMSKISKQSQKFCTVCGSPTEFKIPDGDNKERAVCTVCGHIHYQNPKVVSAVF